MAILTLRLHEHLKDFALGVDGTPEVHPLAAGDHDPALGEQIFDIAEAQCEPEIQPNGAMDDLRWEAVAAAADRSHAPRYDADPISPSPSM